MKIGFVVNDVMTEKAQYTTTRLSMAAVTMGHKAYTLGVGDFIYSPDGSINAYACSASGGKHESLKDYLGKLQSEGANRQRISIDDLDILLLRNDPSEDVAEKAWAQT